MQKCAATVSNMAKAPDETQAASAGGEACELQLQLTMLRTEVESSQVDAAHS